MNSFNCSGWGRWFSAGIKTLRLTPQHLELDRWKEENLKKEATHTQVRWLEIPSPPTLRLGWLLHTISVPVAKNKNIYLRFTSKIVAKSALLALNQGWYSLRVDAIAKSLTAFDLSIQKARYCRTSKWAELTKSLQVWGATLPPIPEREVLSNEQIEVLSAARALVKAPQDYLHRSRQAYIADALTRYASLFETVETMPLTAKQREACVIDDDNNLVLAGAGTGKTSTIMGRVAFLIRSGQAKPEEILLLAYGNKAAAEMRERLEARLGIKGVVATTFHALGQHILTKVEGRKPSITHLAEDPMAKASFVNEQFQRLQAQPAYRALLLKYFTNWLYPERNPFDFKSLGDYYRFLDDNDIRTLKGEKVKSFAECVIANYLFRMGVNYQYEATYQPIQRSATHRAYKPDFFLPDYEIYIEHFGVGRDGNPAPYINSVEYKEGMRWKRSVHKEHKTTLVETFHYEQQEGHLLECLELRLRAAQVVFEPLPPEAILETLREFGAVSTFATVLSQLLSLLKGSNLTPSELDAKISLAAQPDQLRCALELLSPISVSYAEFLGDDLIDFDDMIGKALSYVESGQYQGTWRFVLVDEFQDISRPRAKLVKALRSQQPDGSLFCVGDDWQSIYRFAGSDIQLTSGFSNFFGATQTIALDKTFRFNSSINAAASRFVMVNPQQLRKSITSHTLVSTPAVSLLATADSTFSAVTKVLERICQLAEHGASVYLLARFRFDLPDRNEVGELQRRFPNMSIKTDSIHASKGKEADYVIVLGMGQGKHGLPSEMLTHPLIESLLPPREAHPFAEERRLFYVALTRAKHRVYLVANMARASRFLHELINDEYELERDEFPTSVDQLNAQNLNCPVCKQGTLAVRTNGSTSQRFMGCSNYSRCEHTESVCTICFSPMTVKGRFRICSNQTCLWPIPVCPISGGDLSLRSGSRGKKFWGCSHFRGDEPGSCRHREIYIALPKRPQEPA